MNILSKEEGNKLIKKLQAGTLTVPEENKLYSELQSRFRPHKIENHLYSQDEIEEEFLLASWNALYRAKTDVGDPFAFAIRRGNGAILDYYRKVSRERLVYRCPDCGEVYSYDHRRKSCDNPTCIGELISAEKYEYTDLSVISDSAVDIDFDVPLIFQEIIELIKGLESISAMEKEYCIKAIVNRVSFEEQIIASGKSTVIAKNFHEKMVNLLTPFKDKFLLV